MAVTFLIIIYLSFISLGLPDSLLGVAWPVMQGDLGASFGAAGYISMLISGGTIVSSLLSDRMITRFGTGTVTAVSVLMTAGALFGFSAAPSFLWLLVLALPLGLGAGAVDAGLNNYVAAHYKSHHMSWLHCFWGVGAMLGPMIMSGYISRDASWRNGYLTVAMIQFALVVLLFATLPLWKRAAHVLPSNYVQEEGVQQQKVSNPMKLPGVKMALASFLFYCGTESTMGLWGSSFLVQCKGIDAATAARWVSIFYGGITAGRFISGFITMRMSNRLLIRLGQITSLAGVFLLLLPLPNLCSLAGFLLVGMGCAPIYPCMLHETPVRFGKENSQMVMGFQMAVAYVGSTFLPPFFGAVASATTAGLLPIFLLVYVVGMLVTSEKIGLFLRHRENQA